MKRRGLLAAGGAGVAGLAGLAGCLDALPFGDPPVGQVKVRIIDLRRPDFGVASATLPLVLEFENTADETVPAPVADYDVYVEDVQVGDAGARLTNLDPGETETARARVTVQYTDVGQGVADAVRNRAFTVRIEGTIESEGAEVTSTDEFGYSG